MIGCYDLQCCPPTYDVVAFLALLELERLRLGEERADVHILPGPVGGFRADSLWPRGVEERVALRERVLVPICRMLPSARSVTVRADRSVSGWAKAGRRISLPAIVEALRGSSRPLRARGAPVIGGDYITFTLREAHHHVQRNSRTEEWALAAREIEQRLGTKVIVVRDTTRADDLLEGVGTDNVAAVDLAHRAALYSRARLNVGICNGPMWMAIFMDAPVLMLRPTTNTTHGVYDDRFYARCGLPRGSQLPTSPPHQRLAWEEDYRANIVAVVEDMLAGVPA